MAAINSGQDIGCPVSASTRAAAASALSFLGPPARAGGAAAPFWDFGGLPALVVGAVGFCFFLVAMVLLLGGVLGCRAPRLPRCPRRVRTVTSRDGHVQGNSGKYFACSRACRLSP